MLSVNKQPNAPFASAQTVYTKTQARTWATGLVDDVEREDGWVILWCQASQGVDTAQQAPHMQLVEGAGIWI